MTQINTIPKLGDTGQDVIKLQNALKAKGFYNGTVDGIFGAKTKAAVSEFQKSWGSTGTGEIGPKTLLKLNLEVVAISPVTGKISITSNLKGKKENRVIHPALRLLLEEKMFPQGVIPKCWIDKDVVKCAKMVADALDALKIRETGANKGEIVGMIQGIIGSYTKGGNGDHWCMSTMQIIAAMLEDFFQVESPVEDSEHCVTTYRAAVKVPGLAVEGALEEGGMFIVQYYPKTSGHTGLEYTVHNKFEVTTKEGNTGDKSVNNGDGFYTRERDIRKMGSAKFLGTIRFYPHNKVG